MKTFIDDIVEDDYAQAFVKLIVISKTIGTKIVVEGVEHKEQYDLLKRLGVDYIQGYYFGKPVPAKVFEENNLEGEIGRMNILIKQGRVLDPASKTDKVMDVLIKDGFVASMEENIDESQADDVTGRIRMHGYARTG